MRYLMMVMLSGESAVWFESRKMDSPADFSTMEVFDQEMADAGVLISGNGLYPTASGARIEFNGNGSSLLTDGPFVETKELFGGFWIIDVNSREEAIGWAKRAPMGKEATIVLRRIMEMDEYTPAQQEAAEFTRRA